MCFEEGCVSPPDSTAVSPSDVLTQVVQEDAVSTWDSSMRLCSIK